MSRDFKRLLLLGGVLLFLINKTLAQQSFPFQNPILSIEERIADLIGRLSLNEKALLMEHESPAIGRLGIPAYNWWNECLHGVARAGKATVFPQAIGLAATFDEELIHRVATCISDEARAKYNAARAAGTSQQYLGLSFWTPNVNIFRDPRWGRGQETYGEDPFLTSRIGGAFVRGLQGNDAHSMKAAACAKHFAVHSGPEKTRHSFNATPNERDLRETYLPAFKALVGAGVEAVMCAYNQLNGDPCCANTTLLRSILRDEWGFKGHVVTDCWATSDFISFQHKAASEAEAAAMAVKAGVNLNCGATFRHIPEAVAQGMITERQVDSSLAPLLRTRFKLGLLDEPARVPYARIAPDAVNSEKHRMLAREAAAKSIVLLKNEKATLPLRAGSYKKIFVTGPTAADVEVLLGNYNGVSGNLVTLLEGITDAAGVGVVVDYNPGALLTADSVFSGMYNAASADVVVAAVGISHLIEGEDGDAMLSKSGGDRTDIALPKNQTEFIRRLRSAAPRARLIVVVFGGCSIAFPEAASIADAILFAWYPGEQGGNAVADIIFGKTNPSGRLPVTFYASTSQLPPFDDYSMKGRTYRYFTGAPMYPFGHGLSYSRFEYTNAIVEKTTNRGHDSIRVSCDVMNAGSIDGDEVVQLYLSYPASADAPVKALKGFARVPLRAGETKGVSFTVARDDFALWNSERHRFEVIDGEYRLELGASSADIRLTKTFQP